MNIRNWGQRRGSLRRKLILSVLLMTIPLVGMLLYNNFYAIHVVRGQVADSYNKMLTLYMKQIDTGLNDADAYMNTIGGSTSSDLVSLGQAKTDTEYFSAKVYLFNKLTKEIALYDSINSYFVYQADRKDFMVVSQGNIPYEEIDRVESHVVALMQDGRIAKGTAVKRWQHHHIGQDDYLIDIIQSGNVFMGAVVKTDQLLKPLDSLQIGVDGAVLLANSKGDPITGIDKKKLQGIELQQQKDYYLSGSKEKYLVVGTPSLRGDFSLIALIPDQQILAKLPYLQWIIWLITAVTLLFVPIGLYAMRQSILMPLTRILLAMKKVRSGDWSKRVDLHQTSEEFRLLGESFNAMMTEIETLRVNVYEEQLNKQREELQRLQLQVNPHFFLNALNIVYNLAKVKNFELIMQMTMALIQYFRFLFRSNTSFVKLKDELEHTRNYLSIQILRFPGQLTWQVDSPDYLSDVPVPPLSIQSFVENSIKYAVTMEKPIHIAVRIRFADEESGSHIIIRIEDTGKGFDNDVLIELQAGRSVQNELGEHTGIWNVQRRLRLLYGEQMTIRFFNHGETGGAVVELILPTRAEMEETT
ncbi:histidine kinase [Paenibacillus sp. LHD-38]|uniref:sensor histidine kinase n=1 Tax=Paenibacillus sp. LHD-38 TaxID=3072143 RepID=UPI00280D8445|nr:histidine kinase [Paenibacillus sp. LHD-38]MDQ8735617.1 histidine kinase [Paenibacillus sp. LHD-38]